MPASGLVAGLLADATHPDAPGLIWDLNPTCDRFILLGFAESPIRFSRHVFNGQIVYRVRYQNDVDSEVTWGLFVNATTALELSRRRGVSTVQDATRLLASRGTRPCSARGPQRVRAS